MGESCLRGERKMTDFDNIWTRILVGVAISAFYIIIHAVKEHMGDDD